MDEELKKALGLIEDRMKSDLSTAAKDLVKSELDELTGRVKGLEGKVGFGVSLPGVNEGKEQFSFAKAYNAMATGDWAGAEFEKKVFEETRNKAQSAGVTTAGGFLVPTELSKDIIELVKSRLWCASAGARYLNLAGHGQLDIPRKTGSATAYWLGENANITPSDLTVGKMTLSPKLVAAMVYTSRRLVAMADQSVEQMIREDLAEQLALAIDNKAYYGDGTANTPVGILNTAGISTLTPGADGDVANWQLVDQLIGMLEDADLLRGNTALVSNPKVFRALRRQVVRQFSGDTEGAPLWTPLITNEKLSSELGHKIVASTSFAPAVRGTATSTCPLMFGNFADLLIAQWGGLSLETTQVGGTAWAQHQVGIKATAEVDIGVRLPKSFALAQYVISAP